MSPVCGEIPLARAVTSPIMLADLGVAACFVGPTGREDAAKMDRRHKAVPWRMTQTLEATGAVLHVRRYRVDSAHAEGDALARISAGPPSLVVLGVMVSWSSEGVSISRQMMLSSAI